MIMIVTLSVMIIVSLQNNANCNSISIDSSNVNNSKHDNAAQEEEARG